MVLPCRYLASWDICPKFLKFWVPFVALGVGFSILFIEVRVAVAFGQQAFP